MIVDVCPPDCPERSMTCHSTCQIYLRKKIKDELERKKRQRENDEKEFFRAERAVVKKRKAAKLEEARKRKGFRE